MEVQGLFLLKKAKKENMERPKHISEKELAISGFVQNCPLNDKGLQLLVIPGSRNNATFGNCSDLDVTTIMWQERFIDLVDFSQIINLSKQLKAWADNVAEESSVVPVIISTIRLEEAQIQMAKMMHPGREILPVHWLFHPSVEFLVANEPPELARGILTGHVLKGDAVVVKKMLDSAHPETVKVLKGFDWVTDGLRILLANCSLDGKATRQPAGFLLQNATHNLHWFWKWQIIVPLAKHHTNNPTIVWPQALSVVQEVEPQTADLFNRVHNARHAGEKADIPEIIWLHVQTFSTWLSPSAQQARGIK